MILPSLSFRPATVGVAVLFAVSVQAQPGPSIPFERVGTVQPRHAGDIPSSNWSVGGETLDRDFAVYDNYKEYLGPLGAKQIRLQGGWAKTEREKGRLDFGWLDRVIDDAREQGVDPWLQVSYGNPVYEGGGVADLAGGIPTSEEALAAWDRWVRAMAERYDGRVNVWEIWNESDNRHNPIPADAYAALYIRTAEIIRAVDPDAVLYALSLASPRDKDYTDTFLRYLAERGKLPLVDEITYHGYTYNPDDAYRNVQALREVVSKYSDEITLRQGEQGAPSTPQAGGALGKYDWSELSQAKWALRRLLGDLGMDIPSLYFSMADMNYQGSSSGISTMNTKGLLKANEDKTIAYAKPAYRAMQHVTAIFDPTLTRIPNYPYLAATDSALAVFGYRQQHSDEQVVTLWLSGSTPRNMNETVSLDLTFPQAKFSDPVYVDLRMGDVYAIPADRWTRRGTEYRFTGIPVYDSPVLIADRSAIPMAD